VISFFCTFKYFYWWLFRHEAAAYLYERLEAYYGSGTSPEAVEW
jgi:hypothetical protein